MNKKETKQRLAKNAFFRADRKRSQAEPSRASRAENSRTHHYWIVHPCAYRARSKIRIMKPIRFDVSY